LDNKLLKLEDKKLGERAYINAGPNFWDHAKSYQQEDNFRFFYGKRVGANSND
jgi:hypothetical protein